MLESLTSEPLLLLSETLFLLAKVCKMLMLRARRVLLLTASPDAGTSRPSISLPRIQRGNDRIGKALGSGSHVSTVQVERDVVRLTPRN